MKTAVEWLANDLKQNHGIDLTLYSEFEQAKEMEKEQIMDAYEQGYRDGETNSNTMNYGIDISKFADAKIYYNQTFKSE
jgi:hypothetical protein